MKLCDSLIPILEQVKASPQQGGKEKRLGSSGIGKSLMYLYKHPRETQENQSILIEIIRKDLLVSFLSLSLRRSVL